MSVQILRKTPIALAVTTAVTMLIATNLQAGQIVTDAPEGEALKTAVNTPNQQFGFGGWNLSNVGVSIVSTIDFATVTGSYNPADGSYTSMVLGDSFESAITTGGEVRGLLHGKDWPTGEPSGIKIINGDLETKQGRPENCIMTTSYLENGGPTLCSSPFQSHKRFKINLQPSTVVGVEAGLGSPVEISFNLKEGDTSTQRYQVLQKINNYTGKRLNGYSIEVFDANGEVNPELTVSIGIGENPSNGDEPATDIWDIESRANFSHGLWGPVDQHFDSNGFFDSSRVYYTPAAGSNSISYAGPMLGGNYQALFGNWLPSIWEPTGVFHDEDFNPLTDATLKAFWGDPLKTGTNAWHKGNNDNWDVATEADLLTWSGDWYAQGAVEDVLNLGVNYIVNVGDNTAIGNKFTIRITPSVDADQVEPAYVADVAPEPGYDDSEAIAIVDITFPEVEEAPEDENADEVVDENTSDEVVEETTPDEVVDETTPDEVVDETTPDEVVEETTPDEVVEETTPDEVVDNTAETPEVAARPVEDPVLSTTALITVGVADNDLNTDPLAKETVEVMVTSDHGETEMLTLTESGLNTSRFIGYLNAHASNDAAIDNDGKLNLNKHTNLKATYVDNKYGGQAAPETVEAELAIEVAALPAEADTETSSGGGSFNAFLMMLLGAFGLRGLFARRKQ